MTIIKYYIAIALLTVGVISCKRTDFNDTTFATNSEDPNQLTLKFDISQDNSGKVDFIPNGEGVSTYEIVFGDETPAAATINPGNSISHNYKEGNYNVKLIGHTVSGKSTEITTPLHITYRAPENVEVSISNDPENNHRIIVSASALYASSFEVYFGNSANEKPKVIIQGQSAAHVYDKTGTYSIRVVALSGGKAKTEVTNAITITSPLTIPVNFESSTINYSFTNFDGGASSVIANPHKTGINTSTTVGRMIKHPGQSWGGSILHLDEPINFSNGKIFKIKVWSPKVGGNLLLKVENKNDSGINFEKEATTTVANGWQELVFDFSAVNIDNSYHNLVLIFDLGTTGDGSTNFTYYFDDILLTN